MPSSSKSHITAEKVRLRKRFRGYRRKLTDEEYEHLSRLIADEVKLLPEVEKAKTIHLYWPVTEQREVDTRPLFPWLEEHEKSIILPKVETFDSHSGSASRLLHIRYPGEEKLEVNKWGIAEPPSGEGVDVGSIDLTIVPMLGAGRNGHRIGHGYGYYDEFLASTRATRIGLVYDACVVRRVPSEPHDVPMHILVTERAVIRVASM